MVLSLSVSVEPFANVNVFVPVNVVRVSIDEKFVFTGSKTFTLSTGSNLSDSNITLFQF